MQTVKRYLETVAHAAWAFSIPFRLFGNDDTTTPSEYREADYARVCNTIATSAHRQRAEVQPQVVASLVLEHLLTPGNWRAVAEFCQSWDDIHMVDELKRPDYWTIHVGMVADIMALIDNTLDTARVRAGQRVLDAARPMNDPHRKGRTLHSVCLPCHPQNPVPVLAVHGLIQQDTEVTCRECDNPYVVQRVVTKLLDEGLPTERETCSVAIYGVT